MSSQTPRIRLRGWLVLVPVGAALLLAYRFFGVIGADSLFSINALCQFFLIILGVYVAVKPQSGVEHPWRVIGVLVLLGGIGMIAALRQQQISARETAEAQRQTAEANNKLANSIENLNKGAAEIARVQSLNTDLQRKLLDSSGQILGQGRIISDLSKQAIDTTTGGASFCHMSLTADSKGSAMLPVFHHEGKNPLYDVRARIVNFQLFERGQPMTAAEIMATDVHLLLGELTPNSAWIDRQQTIPFNTANVERQDYKIFFSARNGYWDQDLTWQKTSEGWTTATRVFRQEGTKRKLIFTEIGKGFPKRQLKWHD